ncbi:MAG: ATP-binding protein [Chloroflexota bacterium]|nr:MAG: ATP-binding protein [Chloroflexota bacterium]
MPIVKPLEPSALYHKTGLEDVPFKTTDDLPDLTEVIGQPRAVDAIQFGVGIHQDGYNIFALGPPGTGKRSLIRQHFEQRAAQEPVPDDWVYVHNFKDRYRPRAIRLPVGKGAEFRDDMEKLVEELRTALVAAFESEEYRTRRHVIEQEFQERQESSLEEIQEKARQRNFALLRTPGGLVFAPMRDGEVMSPEEFQKLPEEDRKAFESQIEEFQNELQQMLQRVPEVQREVRERVRALDREVINFAVGGLMDEIKVKYAGFEEIPIYLDEVREDVLQNASEFLSDEEGQNAEGSQNPLAILAARTRASQPSALQRYKVNLVVDHSKSKGAPVVYEDNPTYQNLIGRLEHVAQMGALVTDFTLIKAGSLHLANGGYLILDARKLLTEPYAYEALKRALRSNMITIESLGQMLSIISTISLEPEPIPLEVKIALFGDRNIYYLLYNMDPDFNELFKVQADFEEQMNRDGANQQQYARMIATLVHKNNLRPFDRGAVERVIEHSSRMVEDAERLSMHVQSIADLLREADYWASQNGASNGVVTAGDVQRAIDKAIYRSDRLRERIQETILREIFLIDTQGETVGQINGLSVLNMGSFSFGRPSRITARVRMGKGDVVNIEREVELSGPIHSKGVLILSSFLGGRYAHEKPLSLSASLVFEQSYSGVDGDSASSAELYALLSAIAGAPIKQSLAVTGSVNQHGTVQAIGGVNEKIEGFFDICNARGLTGDQGVMIPSANIKHLMLRHDVVAAVEEGKFHIYPIDDVDQGIELLTGIPAGEPGPDGAYPEGSINWRVQKRLDELAEKSKEKGKEAGEDQARKEGEA